MGEAPRQTGFFSALVSLVRWDRRPVVVQWLDTSDKAHLVASTVGNRPRARAMLKLALDPYSGSEAITRLLLDRLPRLAATLTAEDVTVVSQRLRLAQGQQHAAELVVLKANLTAIVHRNNQWGRRGTMVLLRKLRDTGRAVSYAGWRTTGGNGSSLGGRVMVRIRVRVSGGGSGGVLGSGGASSSDVAPQVAGRCVWWWVVPRCGGWCVGTSEWWCVCWSRRWGWHICGGGTAHVPHVPTLTAVHLPARCRWVSPLCVPRWGFCCVF